MNVLLAGASGTLGSAVLHALLEAGHQVIAPIRPSAQSRLPSSGACTVVVWPEEGLSVDSVAHTEIDVVISCLASRSGSPKDAQRVDYALNEQLLSVAKALSVKRFVLLSAICVQKPRLAFQHQKLAFEQALRVSGLDYTIVRPTAFFKSLSGQIERVNAGKPFLIFGDGNLTACKPISDRDLAAFIVESMAANNCVNRILPIGGPGPALTPREQGYLLFQAFNKPPKWRSVSPKLFDVLALLITPLAWVSEWGRARHEFLRIGNYYATESMLLWDARRQCYDAAQTPETGSDTLADFYQRIARGQEAPPVKDASQSLF